MGADVIDPLVVKQLRTGAYTGTPAAASTGCITFYEEYGTPRKIMVQA